MLRIRLEMGSENKEKYLNTMAEKGRVLTNITPFHLPPLCLLVFKFKQIDHKLRHYRIEHRKFADKEERQEYIQLFEDTGWTYFRKNYDQDGAVDYIFYNDNPTNKEIYSDLQSAHLEKRKQAGMRIYRNIAVLAGVLIVYLMFPPETRGSWAFAIFLIISLVISMLYNCMQYVRHKSKMN